MVLVVVKLAHPEGKPRIQPAPCDVRPPVSAPHGVTRALNSGTIKGAWGDKLVGASVIRNLLACEPIWHRIPVAFAAGIYVALTMVVGAQAQSANEISATPPPLDARENVQSANLPSVTVVDGAPLDAATRAGERAPGTMAPIPNDVPAVKREGPINVHVFGDSLGDGIWAGLYRKLPKADGYRVTKHSRVSTGLVRKDFYDWSKAVRQIVAKHRVDVAVVMIGTNDRQTIVERGRHALRSAGWEEIYKARIDDLTQVLKDEGAEVYWVELPAMRSPRFGRDMRYFNTLFEARAHANGITYVPTWERTLGSNGSYSAYGTDDTGRKRLMRTNDGIHFTMRGYIQLASFVTQAMEQASLPAPTPMGDLLQDTPAPVPAQSIGTPIPPAVAKPVDPVTPAAPASPETPIPTPRPGDDRADAQDADGTPERSQRAGVSEVASTIAGALSDLRGFVLPEPKPGRADDLRQPAE